MSSFKSKPVEAMQWTGENFDAIEEFAPISGYEAYGDRKGSLQIECEYSDEGYLTVHIGDWIVRNAVGECYPCRDETFAKVYDAI